MAVRMFPLSSRRGARSRRARFPGAAALNGCRGGPPIDATRSSQFLLAVAGADGLAARLGDELAELECNPVLATGDAAVALDARLVLRRTPRRTASAEPRPR